MKLKFMLMLAGVVATAAIAATPLVAAAQTGVPQSQEQTNPEQTKPRNPRIVLSERQQAEFEAIQTETFAQIQAILTQEQKAQFDTALQRGQGLDKVENLSDDQLLKLQGILQAFNDRVGGILTQEQRQQIEESIQNQQ